MNIVYVKLLDEGTVVFKPVSAIKLTEETYKLDGWDSYDPIDEVWEFPPGSIVVIEKQLLETQMALIAVSLSI